MIPKSKTLRKALDIPLVNRFPLHTMKVGSKITAPKSDSMELRNAAFYHARVTGRKYKSKTIKDEIKLWRVR